MNLMLGGDFWVFISVNFDDFDTLLHLCIYLIQNVRHHLTGTAPGRVEINQKHTFDTGNEVLKISELLFGCHVFLELKLGSLILMKILRIGDLSRKCRNIIEQFLSLC
jgi:hypothetical protein